MFGEPRLTGFFKIVAFAALILFGWRGLDIVSSGYLGNPFGRVAEAQNAEQPAPEMAGEDAGGETPETETEAAMDKTETDDGAPKRLTASDVMRMRATDVTENMGGDGKASETENTVLMRLGERRAQIDKLEAELAMRERLIEAAEKRIDARIRELKAIEARLQKDADTGSVDEAPALANLVVMYESMKPKDAARIFNTLDLAVLVPVAEQMKPRAMAEVLAAMDANSAQRLTLALARRQTMEPSAASGDLPKIGEDG